MASYDSSSIRPTLPPLHTLDLPYPLSRKHRLQGIHALNHSVQVAGPSQYWRHMPRQVSQASSRTSSPTPSDDIHAHSLASLCTKTVPQTFRLVPCTFEEATAVVIAPPPSLTSSPKDEKLCTLLLTGRSLSQFRHSHPRFWQGARIHPYRIAPSARRLSSSSTSSE